MAKFEKKMVYVITAFFANYEELNYSSPSEEFFRSTWEEAQALKADLEKDPAYSEVFISDDKEEKEILAQ